MTSPSIIPQWLRRAGIKGLCLHWRFILRKRKINDPMTGNIDTYSVLEIFRLSFSLLMIVAVLNVEGSQGHLQLESNTWMPTLTRQECYLLKWTDRRDSPQRQSPAWLIICKSALFRATRQSIRMTKIPGLLALGIPVWALQSNEINIHVENNVLRKAFTTLSS